MTISAYGAIEVVEMVKRMAPMILASVPSKKGETSALLRLSVGALVVNTGDLIGEKALIPAMIDVLNLARESGAGLAQMRRVRAEATNAVITSVGAVTYSQLMVRICLAQEAVIITTMSFKSRDDVEKAVADVTASFSAAAEAASEALDAASYMGIIKLQGDLVRHLTDAARLLPRIVNYDFGQPLPALTMSQRVYQVGDRAQEIIDENHVVHPAFCPAVGKLLAV